MAVEVESGDWREYRHLILNGLREIKEDNKQLRDTVDIRLSAMSNDIVALQVKVKSSARNWVFVGGIVGPLIVLTIWKLSGN